MSDKQRPFEELLPASKPDDKSGNEQAKKDLAIIRHIITANALAEADELHKQQARDYVSNVVSEALSDRQSQDNSVSKILSPIVETSIEKSIANHREQFIDYLYPLVGDLVRKFSVTFMRDFIEKTNELIENSLTTQSIKWRYKAWRGGVSFSKYVASQVYTYQTHQVLLIHRETGILLNSVSKDGEDDSNSDVVSAMLTAISDFISDSFKPSQHKIEKNEKQQLDEIKTDEFILYVRQGPQALLVAAVTGNISPAAKDKLQSTLEQIHSFYLPNLKSFSGDNAAFVATSEDLNECLLAEEKNQEKNSKKPWQAILLFLLLAAGIIFYGVLKWQTSHLADSLYDLPSNQGIVVNRVEINGIHDIQLTVLHDSSAVSIEDWVKQGRIDINQFREWVQLHSIPFISLSPDVIQNHVKTLVADINSASQNINSEHTIEYDPERSQISGKLSVAQAILFNTRLAEIQGLSTFPLAIEITTENENANNEIINQRMLNLLIAEISQLQISFDHASDLVSASEMPKLAQVLNRFEDIKKFASELNQNAKLLVLGTSDSIGNRTINQSLSLARAEHTADVLVGLGIARNDVMTSGLGGIADAPVDTNVRKAIIHVILNKQQPFN